MDTDISDELDRSFDDGPPVDDLDLILTRGHDAVRRRRLTESAALLAVVGVVAGIAIATSGTSGTGDSIGPAGQPTAAVTPSSPPVVPDMVEPDVLVIVEEHPAAGSTPVWIMADGSVHARADVEILRTIADPFDRKDVLSAAAVEYARGDTTYWWVGSVQTNGMTFSTSTRARDGLAFERWVALSAPVRMTDMGEWPGRVDLDLVSFAGDTEDLQPSAGVTILEQRAHPDLPDSFATSADRSAVAEVEYDGERWYVLARQAKGSPPQYIAVSAKDGGPTLTTFLAMAEQRYAEGGGGLL